MKDFGLDLAAIGNGQTAALLDPSSRLVWWCFPRFDGDPVFSRLVAGDQEKGFSDVVLEDLRDFASDYERNTAVVSTLLTDKKEGSVRITDFAPRFRQFGRMFRPPQLIRIIEPVAGLPRITIRVRPTTTMGSSFRSVRSAAITSPSTARISRSGSPPMGPSPISRKRRRLFLPSRSTWCSVPTSR